MIDLHLHTTASDGLCSPGELVARARDAGISVLAVPDRDTMAGVLKLPPRRRRWRSGSSPAE